MRYSERIYLFGSFVLDIGDKEGSFDLLIVELIRVNASAILEISVELRLPRYLSLVDLFVPERMLSQMLPVDPLDRILLEQSLQQVVEKRRHFVTLRCFFFADLSY